MCEGIEEWQRRGGIECPPIIELGSYTDACPVLGRKGEVGLAHGLIGLELSGSIKRNLRAQVESEEFKGLPKGRFVVSRTVKRAALYVPICSLWLTPYQFLRLP
jgi:hypothetical protein